MTSKTQIRTLKTIVAMGGEINFFAGIPGLDSRCEGALVKAGYITKPATCLCYSSEPCSIEHAPLLLPGGERCYRRTRITEAGRAVLAQEG